MNLKTHTAYAEIVPQADGKAVLTIYATGGKVVDGPHECDSVEDAIKIKESLSDNYLKTEEA